MSDSWIELANGTRLDALNIDPSVLTIENISSSLSKLCRFVGHTSKFYSIATHSVIVSRLVERKGGSHAEQMAGLLHDAPEMVTNDLARPIKKLICNESMKSITKQLDNLIYSKFGATWTPLVKECDDIACISEASALLPSKGLSWEGFPPPEDWVTEIINGMEEDESWKEGRDLFVSRFRTLHWWLKE